MWMKVAVGLLIPFLGTTLGAACVFFMKNNISERLRHALSGFAGGIMVSASSKSSCRKCPPAGTITPARSASPSASC